MRFWDDKDGSGNKLTDGRICLVIKSEENPDMPEMRTYGKDREEVLDKVAKIAETAQGQIHRMRKTPASPVPPRPSAAAVTPQPGNGDLVTAVADLSNPAKAGQAIKTLLKTVGTDLDVDQRAKALRAVADMMEKWERDTPDYPKDPRNDRILMKMAAHIAGGAHRITREHVDAAFQEAQQSEMLHEPKSSVPSSGQPDTGADSRTVQPRGSEDSRTGREATSYQRNRLRAAESVARPKQESAKEQQWRTILEKGTGKAQADAIRDEPGYSEWVDKQFQKTA